MFHRSTSPRLPRSTFPQIGGNCKNCLLKIMWPDRVTEYKLFTQIGEKICCTWRFIHGQIGPPTEGSNTRGVFSSDCHFLGLVLNYGQIWPPTEGSIDGTIFRAIAIFVLFQVWSEQATHRGPQQTGENCQLLPFWALYDMVRLDHTHWAPIEGSNGLRSDDFMSDCHFRAKIQCQPGQKHFGYNVCQLYFRYDSSKRASTCHRIQLYENSSRRFPTCYQKRLRKTL